MVASVGRQEIQPMLATVSGAAVAMPPTVTPTASAQPTSTSSAEIAATAAIVTNQKVQKVVAGLSNKINDIDKKVSSDSSFPSVRNTQFEA